MWCKNTNCILNCLNKNNDENSSEAADTSASSTHNNNNKSKTINKMDSLQREKLAMHLVQCAGELVGGINPKPLWWRYAEKNFNFLQNNFQNEVVLKQLFVKCAKLLKTSDVAVNKTGLSKTRYVIGMKKLKKQKTTAALRRSKRPSSVLAQPAPPTALTENLSKAEFLKSFALMPKKPRLQESGSAEDVAPRRKKKLANFANMPISSDLAKRVLAEKKNKMPETFKLKRLEKTERHVNKENLENRVEIDYPVAFNRDDATSCLHNYKMPRRQSHQNNSNGLMKLCRPVVVHLEQMKLDLDGRNSGGGKKQLLVRIAKEERMLCDKKSSVEYLQLKTRKNKDRLSNC